MAISFLVVTMHLKCVLVTNDAFEICRNVSYCCPRKYETWRQYPLIMRGSDKESANCSPYFSALQYINNLETQNILL